MGIFAMLIRSVISYTVFLTSRNIVREGLSFLDNMKYNLRLHRCSNCYRLYSGLIKTCTLCSSQVNPLYQIYQDIQEQVFLEEREGIEKQIYNDTRKFKYEPMKLNKLEVKYDRSSTRTN